MDDGDASGRRLLLQPSVDRLLRSAYSSDHLSPPEGELGLTAFPRLADRESPFLGVAPNGPRHGVPPARVRGVEADPVARPEITPIDLLLDEDEVHYVHPAPELLVIPEVVVQGKLHDPAGQQQLNRFPGGCHLHPALGCRAVHEIVVEPDPELLAVRAHRLPPGGRKTDDIIVPAQARIA